MRIDQSTVETGRESLGGLLRYYLVGSGILGAFAWLLTWLGVHPTLSTILLVLLAVVFAVVNRIGGSQTYGASSNKSVFALLRAIYIVYWSTVNVVRSWIPEALGAVAAAVTLLSLLAVQRYITGDTLSFELQLSIAGALVYWAIWRSSRRLNTAHYRALASQYCVAKLSEILAVSSKAKTIADLNLALPEMFEPLSDRRLWNTDVALRLRIVDESTFKIWDASESTSTDPVEEAVVRHSIASRVAVYAPRTDYGIALVWGIEPSHRSDLNWEVLQFQSQVFQWNAVKSVLCVPMLKAGKPVGVLTVTSLHSSAFSPRDIQFATYIVGVLRESFEILAMYQAATPGRRPGRATPSIKALPSHNRVELEAELSSYDTFNGSWSLAFRGFRHFIHAPRG